MSDVSEQEQIEICSGFMLSAPPGEFMEVVTDVRGLLARDSILNSSAHATFREYNTEQMLQVDSPGHSHKVLITKHGEVSESEYLDPKGGQVLTFDHIKQEVSGSRPIAGELDRGIEELRAAFEDAAFQYCRDYYPSGATTVYGSGNAVTVCITSAKFNPGNYWMGRWRSTWHCEISGGKLTLTGLFKICVHYYEQGNVQLNTKTEKKLSVNKADAASTAREAIKAITQSELQFQQALDTMYHTMGETTFKALRRVLPITRMKIDWNKIRTYKLGPGK